MVAINVLGGFVLMRMQQFVLLFPDLITLWGLI